MIRVTVGILESHVVDAHMPSNGWGKKDNADKPLFSMVALVVMFLFSS